MNNEKLVKMRVASLLIQYKLQTVTLDSLVYIIEDQGYEILEYNLADVATNHILEKLGLTGYAKSRKAFTYKQGLARFVFIFEDLSANEKLIALAHEVGHIFCMHLKAGNAECSVDEEYEANEFSHHLLHPSIWIRFKCWIISHKKYVVVASAAIVAIVIGAILIIQAVRSCSYYGEYYITENGEKYHKEDCIFVKNKTNTERLTEEDYCSGEYEACQICLPED